MGIANTSVDQFTPAEIEANFRSFIAEGGDPASRDNQQRNFLQQMFSHDYIDSIPPEAALAACKVLMEHGLHPDDCERKMTRGWSSPLTMAIGEGNLSVVRLFLEHGADPNLTDFDQGACSTPLALAAKRGQQDICAVLLEYGADPNESTQQKFEGPIPSVDRREEVGYIGAPDHFAIGPLGSPEATPLLLAAAGGHSAVCQVLLEHGADPAKACRVWSYAGEDVSEACWKETPEQAAERSGHTATAGLIRSHIRTTLLESLLPRADAWKPPAGGFAADAQREVAAAMKARGQVEQTHASQRLRARF